MAPSAIAEHPLKEEVVSSKITELVPPPSPDAKRAARAPEDHREIKPAFQFSKAVLLDENHFKIGSRAPRLAASVLLHVTLIAVPVFIGLFFTDTINIKQYAAAMLVAPPPPPAVTPSNYLCHQGCEFPREIHHRRQALCADSHSQANR